jgi:hypothetical protein
MQIASKGLKSATRLGSHAELSGMAPMSAPVPVIIPMADKSHRIPSERLMIALLL